jgi:hypothetical protein
MMAVALRSSSSGSNFGSGFAAFGNFLRCAFTALSRKVTAMPSLSASAFLTWAYLSGCSFANSLALALASWSASGDNGGASGSGASPLRAIYLSAVRRVALIYPSSRSEIFLYSSSIAPYPYSISSLHSAKMRIACSAVISPPDKATVAVSI